MKVIDLLNKIANGEQPKHIRIYNEDWYWNEYDGYVTKWSLSTTPDAQHYLFGQYRLDFALNKEVEIIEDKTLEKINTESYWDNSSLMDEEWTSSELILVVKINEIIDKINEMRNE